MCYYCQIVMFKKKALLYKKNFCLPNSKFFSPAAVTALMGKEMKTFPSNKKTTFWCVLCRVSFNLILLLLCYYLSNNKKIVIYRSTYWSTQRTTAISCKLYKQYAPHIIHYWIHFTKLFKNSFHSTVQISQRCPEISAPS